MATASIPGFRASFYLATSSSGGSIVKFGELKDFTLQVAANPMEATSKDSAGWREFLPGLREWSGSGSGLYLLETTDIGQSTIYNALTAAGNSNPIWVSLRQAASSASATAIQEFQGQAVVTGFDIESPLDGPAGIKISIKGTAPLTKQAATS